MDEVDDDDTGDVVDAIGEGDQNITIPECKIKFEAELPESITSMSLTPKGKLLGISTVDPEITILDADTGEIKFTLPGHDGGTNCVAFLSGVLLASCGEDGKAKIWNLAHQKCLVELHVDGIDVDRTRKGHTVNHLTVSPDKKSFAVAAGKSVVRYTITGDGASSSAPKIKVLSETPSTIESLRYCASNGNLMAAYHGGVTVWDLLNRENEKQQALDLPYGGACLSVDASPDMKWVVAGCHDATLHIFKITEQKEKGIHVVELSCGGYESKVKFCEFQPRGKWLASSGGTRSIIWDFSVSPDGSIPTLTLGHRKPITCQAWQPRDGNPTDPDDDMCLLATGSKDGTVLLYDVENLAEVGEPNICLPGVMAPCPDANDEPTFILWRESTFFYVGHVSGLVRAWELPYSLEEESSSEEEEEVE